MLDEYGVPVWYQRTPYPVVGVFPQANGDLAWRRWTPGIGGFPPLDPDADPDRDPQPRRQRGQHGQPADPEVVGWHDFVTLPNGNHIVTSYPRRRLTAGFRRSAISGWTARSRRRRSLVDGEMTELDPCRQRRVAVEHQDHRAFSETCCRSASTSLGPGTDWALDLAHINPSTCSPTATCSSASVTSTR